MREGRRIRPVHGGGRLIQEIRRDLHPVRMLRSETVTVRLLGRDFPEEGSALGEKDILEKTLEAYNDVFADIVNGLLFKGEPIVSPDALVDAQARSFYAMEDEAHSQERDVAKYWNRGTRVRIAVLGLENQTEVDRDMPFRVIGYDGASYRSELTGGPDRYPVITLVLYFGRKRWKNRSLCQAMEVPEILKPYVSDYKINVFEIAHLTDEEIGRFRSDFQVVADYVAHSRTDPDYRPTNPKRFEHASELLRLMSAVSGDDRYEQVIDAKGGAPKDMCEVLDRVEQKGIALGLERGMAQGIERGMAQGMAQGLERGMAQGIERGMAQGIERGMAQGIERGMAQGIEQGEIIRARKMVLNLRDSGMITEPSVIAKLAEVPQELVERWLKEGSGAQ